MAAWLQLIIAAAISAGVSWVVARWTISKGRRSDELRLAHADVMMAIDEYINWLQKLWRASDPTLRGQPAPYYDEHEILQAYEKMIGEIEDGRFLGRNVLAAIQDHRVDFPMTDSLLEDLGRVVTAVDEYWRNLKAQVVRNLPGDTLGQVLMRSLLELDVLDGPQVLRAGEAISELRERVHEFYKACVYGKKAEGLRKQPDSYKFIVERDVEWFYEGDVPFASDDYLKAHKLLPPEREGYTAPSNARVFKPVEDEGAEESDPGIDGRPRD